MPEPYSIFEVTIRTIQGRFLLLPSEKLNELVLGVFGRALTLSQVRLHLFVVVSNHMHLLVSAPKTQSLAEFMCYLDSNIAKEAGRLHGWKQKFWGRRYSAIPILDDESLISRVRYILSHGCKEGLVLRPCDWPGVNCVAALTQGHKLIGRWYDRTLEYEAKTHNRPYKAQQFSTTYEVPLTPLPGIESLGRKEQQAWWRKIVSDLETETRERLEQEQRRAMGRAAIMAQDPHGRPDQPKHSPRPWCHAIEKASYECFREAYALFVEVYRQAHELLKKGDPRSFSLFPADCYIPPLALRLGSACFSSA